MRGWGKAEGTRRSRWLQGVELQLAGHWSPPPDLCVKTRQLAQPCIPARPAVDQLARRIALASIESGEASTTPSMVPSRRVMSTVLTEQTNTSSSNNEPRPPNCWCTVFVRMAVRTKHSFEMASCLEMNSSSKNCSTSHVPAYPEQITPGATTTLESPCSADAGAMFCTCVHHCTYLSDSSEGDELFLMPTDKLLPYHVL